MFVWSPSPCLHASCHLYKEGLSVRPFVCSSVRPSVLLLVFPPVRPSIRPSIRSSARQSVRLSVRPSVSPSVSPAFVKNKENQYFCHIRAREGLLSSLDEFIHLYKTVCPSVTQSIRQSVSQLVRLSHLKTDEYRSFLTSRTCHASRYRAIVETCHYATILSSMWTHRWPDGPCTKLIRTGRKNR